MGMLISRRLYVLDNFAISLKFLVNQVNVKLSQICDMQSQTPIDSYIVFQHDKTTLF